MDTIILIPAYKPDEALLRLVQQLKGNDFHILIVDDGSGSAFAPIFDAVRGSAEVIGYEKNCGKGYALKYGIAYIRENYASYRYFVTADADGQHAVRDILRVSEMIHKKGGIVLGSRAFSGKIPLRSRVGNNLSRFVYAIASSLYLQDNQTGLRAFEVSYCEWLCSIGGSRYDYEINMLMYAAKRNIPIHEAAIQTIYEDGNKSSHFRPIPDTLRLHAKILLASVPSFFAFLLQLAATFFLYGYLLGRQTSLSVEAVRELSILNGGTIGIAVSFLLNTCRFATRTGVPFRLSWRKLLVAVIRLSAYQLFVRLLKIVLPQLTFVPALLITVLLVVVLEFFLLKLIFLLQNRNEIDPRTRNL